MKNILFLISVILSCCIIAKSQTPSGPLINTAIQVFKEGSSFQSNRTLSISQHISPRVIKPGANCEFEYVYVMFIGHWLDITDEVLVKAPNENRPNGVTFSKIIEKKNGPCNTIYTRSSSVFPNYNGAYVVVEFKVMPNAPLGTHTVILRRPNATFGKDESIPFYLEVMHLPRVHTITFKENTDTRSTGSGRINETGTIYIKGQNLNLITTTQFTRKIGLINQLGEIRNINISPSQISFNCKLLNQGTIDYDKIMPTNLQNPEYPLGYTTHNLTIRAATTTNSNRTSTGSTRSGSLTFTTNETQATPADLAVTFRNTFISTNILDQNEKGNYNICPTTENFNKPTTIPTLIVRVTNLGQSTSNACSLNFFKNGNTNFERDLTFTVPAIAPGSYVEFSIARIVNTLGALLDRHGICGRTGLPWNDKNVSAQLNNCEQDDNEFNNRTTIQ